MKKVEIDEYHPYYQMMVNFQAAHASGKPLSKAWVRSYCLYESPLIEPIILCTLQIVLSERAILFGKDPAKIINYSLIIGDKLLRMSSFDQNEIYHAYTRQLLLIYAQLLRFFAQIHIKKLIV
jgi:hypothetical protein